MRLIMMGTGPFAVPTFESLLDSDHEVAVLVTRPTSPPRGRRKSPVNPMRDVALARGVDIVEPESVNDDQSRRQLAALQADLQVVCDYGQILSSDALATARLGGINLHASLLPKYRGAAPINWAIYHGETETGVTVIHMSPLLDAGPALVQKATPIQSDETAVELEERLAQMGVQAVADSIAMLSTWDGQSPLGIVQDPGLVSRAPRLKKSDALVDWSRSAEQICCQVRAFKPWPGSYTYWQHEGSEPLRLILDRVRVFSETTEPAPPCSVVPGSVVAVDAERLWIATGDGTLSLDRVQPAGKRPMEVAEFLCGNHLQVGQVLGNAELGTRNSQREEKI